MSLSEQTGRLAQTSTLHRIHLALARSLCFWLQISRLAVRCWKLHLKPGRLTSLLYYSTNDLSSIFSLPSLELCKLKHRCLKHRKTLWNCIVFLKGLKCLALVSSQNIARSPGATRVATWYNFLPSAPGFHTVCCSKWEMFACYRSCGCGTFLARPKVSNSRWLKHI